jgi:N-acetylneuraminic acid mutarotase
MYDPSTDNWTQKASMPTNRARYGVAVLEGKIYCMGGTTSSGPANINEVYDPTTDSWSTKAPLPLSVTQMCANGVNGKIYVIGGYLPSEGAGIVPKISGSTQIYHPSNDSWSVADSQILTPVESYASTVIDNKIYVSGGESGIGYVTGLLQIYDTQTDDWTYGPSLPTEVRHVGAAATTGVYAPKLLYVIGGDGGGYPSATNQIYNIESQTWSNGTDFPTTHDWITDGITVVCFNDTLFVVGGLANANEGFYEITQQYIPANYTMPSPSPSVPEFSGLLILLVIGVPVVAIALILRGGSLSNYIKRQK